MLPTVEQWDFRSLPLQLPFMKITTIITLYGFNYFLRGYRSFVKADS